MSKHAKAGKKPSTPNVTERQHFVWRAYLKSWPANNYLYYYRRKNGDVRRASPKKIAQSSFFYASEEMTEGDFSFLRMLISGFPSPELRELAQGWIDLLQLPHRASPFLQSLNLPDSLKKQAIADMDIEAKTVVEKLHAKIETDVAPLLERLRSKDLGFFKDDELRSLFVIFLSNQYFRTEKMRLSIPFNRSAIKGHNPRRTALVESLIFATNVGASLFAQWGKYRPFIIESDGSAPFITGDQPVINLFGKNGGPMKNEIELYYPLSPALALLISPNKSKYRESLTTVGKMTIETYNLMILEKSEQDVYCNDKSYLEIFVKDIKHA